MLLYIYRGLYAIWRPIHLLIIYNYLYIYTISYLAVYTLYSTYTSPGSGVGKCWKKGILGSCTAPDRPPRHPYRGTQHLIL